MVKLAESLAPKGGNYFTVPDVIGQELLITEDVGPELDIRVEMDEAKGKVKYYCFQVTDGADTKDLHAPPGAMKVIADKLGKYPNWKGKRFEITKVIGSGFKTKTFVEERTSKPGDERLPTESATPTPEKKEGSGDPYKPVIEKIKAAQELMPVTDDILTNIVKAVHPEQGKADMVTKIIKDKGLIYIDGKTNSWKVVT